jgi:hypothetical protein|tara:strand:- start:298 stop:546 length:249 start_codon:yes stop_codon:yes gene_type:complete
MSKIEEKELEVLQEQEKKKGAILHDLGLLDTQRHSLMHIYADLMKEQQDSKTELEEKYGKININLSDGSFEEIKEEQDEENK